jgi:pyrroline-5-carboxylate reductase
VKAPVFLGGGRITSALVAGLRTAGYKQPIGVHDRHQAKLRDLARRYGVHAEADLRSAVARAELLIVAVRPASVRELLNALHGLELPELGVSLAAGIPLELLKELAPSVKWVRAMPSPVCRSAKGLTALSFEARFPRSGKNRIESFFRSVGQTIEMPEGQFDLFTVTYSSSHGYHALAALAEAAQGLGLAPKVAMVAAAHALADGIQYWRESKSSLPELLHEAATPGGIAGTVMATMDSAGYRTVVRRGLEAGLRRARQNSKS